MDKKKEEETVDTTRCYTLGSAVRGVASRVSIPDICFDCSFAVSSVQSSMASVWVSLAMACPSAIAELAIFARAFGDASGSQRKRVCSGTIDAADAMETRSFC